MTTKARDKYKVDKTREGTFKWKAKQDIYMFVTLGDDTGNELMFIKGNIYTMRAKTKYSYLTDSESIHDQYITREFLTKYFEEVK
ncbi:hypothetical protein BC7_00054 [Bacillus phage BC-7]|nr:hypothetical protein BC7_00054 [Bacillus phage BC-7]